MLRTMQGRASSLSGGSNSPKVTQDMYVMHQGITKSPGSSTYVSSQALQRGLLKSAAATTGRSGSQAEPPPLPEKKTIRRNYGSAGSERSFSTSAVLNSPTSPTTATPGSQPQISLQQTLSEDAFRSEDGSPKLSQAAASKGRGSPLMQTRSSPPVQQKPSSPGVRVSPPADHRPVNGSPTPLPKDPPKVGNCALDFCLIDWYLLRSIARVLTEFGVLAKVLLTCHRL